MIDGDEFSVGDVVLTKYGTGLVIELSILPRWPDIVCDVVYKSPYVPYKSVLVSLDGHSGCEWFTPYEVMSLKHHK
jgi:uncharacterized protein YodC (DUF2158 family)